MRWWWTVEWANPSESVIFSYIGCNKLWKLPWFAVPNLYLWPIKIMLYSWPNMGPNSHDSPRNVGLKQVETLELIFSIVGLSISRWQVLVSIAHPLFLWTLRICLRYKSGQYSGPNMGPNSHDSPRNVGLKQVETLELLFSIVGLSISRWQILVSIAHTLFLWTLRICLCYKSGQCLARWVHAQPSISIIAHPMLVRNVTVFFNILGSNIEELLSWQQTSVKVTYQFMVRRAPGLHVYIVYIYVYILWSVHRWTKRYEPHTWFAFFTKTGWAWHVTIYCVIHESHMLKVVWTKW